VELRQLEAFAVVAAELHFGRAAERLHLAAPTLSELIRRLERELGTPLLTRTTRRVALTSAGAELLARSKVILEEVAAARAAVSRVAGGEVFCAEPLLVGLRPEHRLAGRRAVALSDLAHDVLGTMPADLFPAWAMSQRQALEAAGTRPPSVDLADTDLAATRWAGQPDVDWILLVGSLAAGHTRTVVLPVEPEQLVPFTLQWSPDRAHARAVARFVHTTLTAELPDGWRTLPDHLHHLE
jgi:DNA-binding transcriptional LysR family regulator